MSRILIKSSISEVRIAVARAVPAVIDETADNAIENIAHETERHHMGRVYKSRRELGTEHTASAPGESFATDTASLINGMEKNVLTPLTTEIDFSDLIGAGRWTIFEFGGGRVAARPTVVPIFNHMQDSFTRDVAGAVLHALTEQEVA